MLDLFNSVTVYIFIDIYLLFIYYLDFRSVLEYVYW